MYPIGNVSYALALVQKWKQSFMDLATFMYITSHLLDIDLLPRLTACFGQFGFPSKLCLSLSMALFDLHSKQLNTRV